VYFGRHPKASEAFMRLHADAISSRPSAFLSVSGWAGSSDEAERGKADQLARRLLAHTGVRPSLVGIAGGALAYPRYGFLTRWIIRRISARRGGPTDTTRVHEATDWAALDEMIGDFVRLLERASASAHAP
jgi:menaquinone-dependent protoporphyrinogen oxidase